MDFRQKYGPWALVTGASAGLGRCYAEALAARGLGIILVARREDRLESLAEELRSTHAVQVQSIPLDLCADNSVETLCEILDEKEIGLIVNNAGFGHAGPFEEQSFADLRQMLRLNCEVPSLLAHSLLPKIKSRGHGGMIVLASAAGYQPTPWMAAYGASKAYDLLWAESLAVESKKSGIDILAVSPGHTASEFLHGAGGEGAVAGGTADPRDVVNKSLKLLGKKISFVHGRHNYWLTWTSRWFPRKWVAQISGKLLGSRLIR